MILGTVALFCLTPMLRFFGSPDNVLAYAKTYTGITALGFPFLILTNGGGRVCPFIRAGRDEKYHHNCLSEYREPD